MKKSKTLIVLILLLLISTAAFLFSLFFSIDQDDNSRICINESCFNVEVANTPEKRSIGLMHRSFLNDDAGMIFIFQEEKKHSFWMKNTLLPLDLIWIDSNKRITHIKNNVQPCKTDLCPSYVPPTPALYVLELNAGSAQNNYLEVGQKVHFLKIEKFE